VSESSKKKSCKLLIIGAGPGGYATAIRAGQLGVDTIVVDRQKPGGTCLNVGCIPSKALIHAASDFAKARYQALTYQRKEFDTGIRVVAPSINLEKTVLWKDNIVKRLNLGVSGLVKKAGATFLSGEADIIDGKTVSVSNDDGEIIISCENLVIATGSVPVELPFLKFGGPVISSTGALSLEAVPEKLAIVGGGYIGLELGIAYAKLGSHVTIVEAEKHLLPQYDVDLVAPVLKTLKSYGADVYTQTFAKGLSSDEKNLIVKTPDDDNLEIPVEKVLVTVGRRSNVDGFSLDGLMLDRDGAFIKVDKKAQTSMRGVYAIGDVTGDPMLAHRAIAQGEMVAEIIAGKEREWDKQVIPEICFTDPEIVSVGLSPEAAKEMAQKGDFELMINSFPFFANGRAMTMENEAGFIRILARRDNHLVLGIHAVGGGVAELSASFALAIEMGARLEDIAATIHAHPTQSEAFQEAAMRVLGHSLHI